MRSKLITSAIVLTAAGSPVSANDWYTGAPMSGQPTTFSPLGSVDLSIAAVTRAQHAVVQGTLGPFGGLEQTGLRVRVGGMVGSYVYNSTTPGVGKVRGDQTGGALLVGHEWVVDRTKFSVYGGLDVLNTTLDRYDPRNRTAGASFGFKGVLEFYSTPTRATMAAGALTLSSVNAAYYMRLKAGVAIHEQVYIGPEVLAMGDTFYTQGRVGVHLSGVKLGPVQLGLSGGYAHDRVRGGGAYGILDARMTF
jgi:hypothetical protein